LSRRRGEAGIDTHQGDIMFTRLPLLNRRTGLLLLAGSLFTWCAGAAASDWPTRPIRLVLPAAPGGSSDPMARVIADELGKALGQSVIVENRPGANGNIGAAFAAKSPADGYTMLLAWPGTVVSAVTMYDSKPFNPQKDFDTIVLVASVPNVIVVNPSLPVNTLKELAEYARKNPGKLNFGSTGSGSSYQLAAELFKKMEGVSMIHVPYTSPGAVFTDLLGGRLQVAFPGAAAVAGLVKDGKLRALATMSDTRSSVMPQTPTTKELGYTNLTAETWFGLMTPKGTPPEIIARINKAMNDALATPAFREKLATMGYTPMGSTPAQFDRLLADDIVKWGEVVKFSGAKVE
jgi:tripartite-type tricarboxylate transporter receptor subunit TctC